MRAAIAHCAARLRSLRIIADARGVAGVEFALVLPMLLFVGLGGYTLTDAAATYRKLTDTTVETANVAAQYTSMAGADADSVMAATSQIMAPYSTANLTAVLSLITTDANSKATVTWSRPYPAGGAKLTAGATFTLPNSLAQPSTSYVLVTTTYNFVPLTGSGIVGSIPMKDQLIILPRNSPSIPCSTC